MMKSTLCFHLLLLIAVAISGCMPSRLTPTPTPMEAHFPSPTAILPTSTPMPVPTATATFTQPATLEPEQAKETIQTLLLEPVDCSAPCFWGIMPSQTTLNEAKNIFTHLGLQIESTTYQSKDLHGIRYDSDSGLSVIVTLTVQEEIVENLRVDITPETQRTGVPREWSAYSLATLVARHGLPSMVDFFLGRREPPRYSMQVYFETVDLIIQYGSFDITFVPVGIRVCPLADQYDSIGVWLGKDPEHPPGAGIPLEQATSLTLEGFSKLMIGDPQNACFALKAEAFP